MNIKIKIFKKIASYVATIFFGLAIFCVANIIFQAPLTNAADTCSAGTTCNDSGGGCKYCSVTNRVTGPGYYTGGALTIPCSSSSPISCWIDAGCWRNNIPSGATFGSATTATPPTFLGTSGTSCCNAFDCLDQTCKVKSCSSNSCSYSNATDGTSCGTNKQCKSGSCVTAPSCVAYNNTVNSGDTVTFSVSAANADRWSAVCTNFTCDAYICEYTGGTQTYPGGSISGTITSSNVQFYNDSGSTKTRQCVYTVTNNTTGLRGTCTGVNTVYNGISKPEDPPPGPTCTGYNYIIDSGQSQAAWVSACGSCVVDRWSAVCEDFRCDSYDCIYDSSTYTQNYRETAFSGGTFGANLRYANTSGSRKSRRCVYTIWNHDNPTSKGTCVGTVSVNSGDPTEPAGCTGYNFTINSGQAQAAWVSAAGANMWSAVCEDFRCDSYNCEYSSPSYTQNYNVPAGASFSSTFGANARFTNNSGSKQTRRCTYSVWDSATPTSKGTCVGSVNVCSEGYTWNGVSCIDNSSCVPNSNCSASSLATKCTTDPPCFDGCSYKAGTKICTMPTLNFSANPPSPIIYNTSTDLTWNTAGGVTSCWGWSDDGIWDGWKTLSEIAESTGNLTASKIYNMECWNASGVSTGVKTVTVVVSPSSLCGDGSTEGAEDCDKGPSNGSCPAICSSSCTFNNCPPPPPCVDDTDAANICKGQIYMNKCDNSIKISGTKDCTWREVAP